MNDRLVRFLNQYGFQPVFLAETGVTPPDLYNFTADRRLVRRGPLQDYVSGKDIGAMVTEGVRPDLEHSETTSKGASAAVSFLKSALAAIGVAGRFGININRTRSTEFKFAFTGVTSRRVDASKIEKLVQEADFAGRIPPDFFDAGRLHIAYEYLYTKTLLMRKGDNSAFEAEIAASPKDIIEGEAKVSVTMESQTTIRFAATGEPAAFAYKAGRLERWPGGIIYFYPEEVGVLPDRAHRHEMELAGASPVTRYVYTPEMEPLLAMLSLEHPIVRRPFLPAEGVVLRAE